MDAFILPEKDDDDTQSYSFSFDIQGEKIIAKYSHDNYIEVGSYCQNDQKYDGSLGTNFCS